jgi:hypothetical protein
MIAVLTIGSFFSRKYSEGRKDHWFVSESNGLSYAGKFRVNQVFHAPVSVRIRVST